MRSACGLGLVLLLSGVLAAQQRYGGTGAHNGQGYNGVRNGGHEVPHHRYVGTVWIPYAYPMYGYGAPDQGYTNSYAPGPAEAPPDQGPGPEYPAAVPPPPPEPPPHGFVLNFDDSDAVKPEPTHYYIALKDHHVYLAVAYWVEGDTLHYFLPGNTHNQVSLSLLDRELMARLNRESGVVVTLPPAK